MLRDILFVAAGGAAGSVLRYLSYLYVPLLFGRSSVFTGTFAVNILGCLLIGFLMQWMELRQVVDGSVRLLILAGFLGGFTTFSTFGLEGLELFRHSTGNFLLYTGLHLLLGIGGVWAGALIGQQLFQT